MKEREKKVVLVYKEDYEVVAKRVTLRDNFSDVLHAALVAAGWIKARKTPKKVVAGVGA